MEPLVKAMKINFSVILKNEKIERVKKYVV